MAKREILQINTPEGDAILRTRARKISRLDEEAIQIARDLVETLTAAGDGIAIAAPQIGEPVRMIAVNIPPKYLDEEDPGFQSVLYNPQIIRRRGGKEIEDEGCRSLHYWYGPVERDISVVVRAYDMQDRQIQITADGFLARVLQHEIDHLDGIMFTDYMENPEAQLRYVPPRDPNAPDADDEDEETADHMAERAAIAE